MGITSRMGLSQETRGWNLSLTLLAISATEYNGAYFWVDTLIPSLSYSFCTSLCRQEGGIPSQLSGFPTPKLYPEILVCVCVGVHMGDGAHGEYDAHGCWCAWGVMHKGCVISMGVDAHGRLMCMGGGAQGGWCACAVDVYVGMLCKEGMVGMDVLVHLGGWCAWEVVAHGGVDAHWGMAYREGYFISATWVHFAPWCISFQCALNSKYL